MNERQSAGGSATLRRPGPRASERAPAAPQPPAGPDWTAWVDRALSPMTAVLGKLLGVEDPAVKRARRRTMPCDVFLSMGFASVRLFVRGQVEDFAFFQRGDVPASHDVEFLTRLDPGAGGEDYKAYGLLKLKGGRPLPALPSAHPAWDELEREHGLLGVPQARSLVEGGEWRTFDARTADPASGRNRLVPSDRVWKTVRGKRITHGDVLELLRRHLSADERIAWIEQAFTRPLEPGQIVHRYYIDADKQVWLVRHHWRDGKHIIAAETGAEAKKLCAESGALTRPRAE